MSIRLLQRAFSAGEITPELFGRVDLSKRQEGLAICRNFITLPHGPAVNRPGTEFVQEVKNSANATRVIPFSYNNTQTFVIQVGAGYFRWHTNGATLLYATPAAYNGATAYAIGDMVSSGGVNYYCKAATTGNAPPNTTYWYPMPTNPNIYEIPNSYAAADLMDIHYVQSADVLTLVHPSYPPMELRRYGATNWQTAFPTFVPPSSPLTNLVITPTGTGTVTYGYVVTAVRATGLEETLASTPALGSLTATITGATQANPGVITTSAAHGLAVGDPIQITGVVGMTQLNNNYYVVNTVPTTTTLTLALGGAPVNTTGFTAYTSGGTIKMAGVKNNLSTAGNQNIINWTDGDAVGNNVRYYVYKLSNGLYGYIGQSSSTSFIDNNITADVSKTPPIADTTAAFASSGNYPAAVSYYQQRRIFGGANNLPQNLWATRSGTESNMSYTIPVQSDNRIAVRIAAREASAIRHIVPSGQLLLLTASCEFKCGASSNGDVLTPTSINIAPQSYVGANNVPPVVVNNIVLYAAARGGHVRELSYSWQASSYTSSDISLMAPHLFDYNTILDMCYGRGPIPILWAVSSTGGLLGMTYVPEQQVSAWHRHDTVNGVFESCCTITENNEDMLYLVVKRTISGATKRYIERMHTRQFTTLADAFFVDCGLTYSGTAVSSVSGLSHLEGQTVNILADGAVQPQAVVTSGAVSLPTGVTATKISVGLPITAQMQTLPVAAQIDGGMAQGRQKNVNKAFLRVYRSSGILVGPDFNSLVPFKQRTTENYGSPPNLVSDEIEVVMSNSWGASGQVCVQQADPLPLDIASMTLEVAMGG